jgi:hypothetical protein
MSRPPFPVSDHAVLRYLERVRGLDVEAVRAEIAREVAVAGEHPGASAVRAGAWLYQIRDGMVVTVHRACRPDLRTGRQRRERRE